MLKIELLESFIAVAECGNLSKAADKICRTQSTLSLQVKKLEESVGQTLLIRDNKGVTLTESGETLLNYAYKMMQLNSQAIDELKDCQNREVIRLGVPTDFIKCYLSSCLLEFIREFTSIELVIDTDVSGNLYKRLHQGEFDVIVATHWQVPTNGELLFTRRFKWVSAVEGNAHKRISAKRFRWDYTQKIVRLERKCLLTIDSQCDLLMCCCRLHHHKPCAWLLRMT